MKTLIFCCLAALIEGLNQPCNPRTYAFDSAVCVCSKDYCDSVAPVEPLEAHTAALYVSSKQGQRLDKSIVKWKVANYTGRLSTADVQIKVATSVEYQKILGFGGAFTDATGINIASLTAPTQQKLLQAYFSASGLKYSIGRIPIGSCDFSPYEYSYDDTAGDFHLANFSLHHEDLVHKIPFIKAANDMAAHKLRLFGSPWTAPVWMKTSGKFSGNGTLKGKPGDRYHKTWANYFVRFLKAYQKHNISVWGLTAQNEPTSGFIYKYSFQTMGFTPETQRDFIKLDLGPALHANGFQDVKLMILDDQRMMLPQWAKIVLNDAEARKFISGIAVHWYYDRFIPAEVLSATHRLYPNTFLLASEACTGSVAGPFKGPKLGYWNRAERYAKDIMQDMNNWVGGWVDWNMALDLSGGPNWAKNVVDSPVIVNSTADEFYKQPMFYAMGHFSAFVPPNSIRIGFKITGTKAQLIYGTAFKTPEGRTVLILLNRQTQKIDADVSLVNQPGRILRLPLKPRSIATAVWN